MARMSSWCTITHPFALTGLKMDVCLNIMDPTGGTASVLCLKKIKDIVSSICYQYRYEVQTGTFQQTCFHRNIGSTAMWLITQFQMPLTGLYFIKNVTLASRKQITF